MKKLIILVSVALFALACNRDNVPEGIIDKDKMLNVMIDMQLTDAYLNQVYNNDTMKMEAHSRYNYVFSKFKIDSAMFTNSLKYYSLRPTELDEMYTEVSDSLTRLQESLKPVRNGVKTQPYNLYRYVFNRFTIDSPKFGNMNYYRLDVKKLYDRYSQLDSLKQVQDSLKSKPVKVEETKKLKEIKHDLSTK